MMENPFLLNDNELQNGLKNGLCDLTVAMEMRPCIAYCKYYGRI